MQIKINDNLTENIKDISVSTGGGVFNLSELNTYLLNLLYPIGYIYISVNSTNPSIIFGGTWEQIKDRFLLACGTTYSNGSIGGESTHTLTSNEMPSHYHLNSPNGFICNTLANGGPGAWSGNSGNNLGSSNTTTSTGGNQAHNNMPPYLAVYMWKRIS